MGQQTVESFLKAQLDHSVLLSECLEEFNKEQKLSKAERLEIVEQALLLLEMNYVHLPLKRAMHAVDPIQRLKRLKFKLMETKASDLPGDMDFYFEIQKVFISTRDVHTSFSLPAPFKERTAFLPFIIEEYFIRKGKRQEPRYLVSHMVEQEYLNLHLDEEAEYKDIKDFEAGVEVIHWNGVPIRRAIEINAEKQPGSNPEARFARGLDTMTIRPLNSTLPPDEMWVIVTYRTAKDRDSIKELRLNWRTYISKPAWRSLEKRGSKAIANKRVKAKARLSLNIQKDSINQVRRTLFNSDEKMRHKRLKQEAEQTRLGNVFRPARYTIANKEIAYIRIFTFSVDDVDEFLREFLRLIKKLPQEGLIIDVRGNAGGTIEAGERLLQILTPYRVKPALFEFINTPLNLELCRRAPKDWEFYPWKDSIAQAVDTGAVYSQALPLTSEKACNEIGQVYYGPVVLITDALCYSTTDIFAAGFQDHKIGKVLGTSGNTGAGGANVVKHKQLVEWLGGNGDSPFKTLPARMAMRVALRRSVRIGKYAGIPLEELGVIPDHRHYITENDLIYGDVDLMTAAAKILKAKRPYSISVQIDRKRALVIRTRNISRLDVYIDNYPYASKWVAEGGTTTLRNVIREGRLPRIQIAGYDSRSNLVAKYHSSRWVSIPDASASS